MQMNPQAHTGSYYAASANEGTTFTPLRGEQSADVCVIGAGFTGISVTTSTSSKRIKSAGVHQVVTAAR
jgi:NADH dehydrogenase FAD-containing subunit